MKQITFRWAGDAPSSGDAHVGGRRRVVVIPKVGIQTPDAILGWPPGNQGLMHPRLASDGRTFAGTGKDDHDRAWQWSPAAGWTDEGPGYGPKSCIYVGSTLHVVRPSPAGAIGYRHVKDDGTIVSAAESRVEPIADPRSGLFEFTDYGDICLGQLDDERYGGGVGVRFADGILRRVTFQDLRARGKIVDVVVDRRGQDFAIVAVDLEQHRTTITEGTFEELHAMLPAVPIVALPPAPPEVELPAIGRACWIGFAMFADGPRAPGNCIFAVRRVYGPQSRPFIVTDESVGVAIGDVLGYWVAAEGVPGAGVDYIESWAVRVHQDGYRPVAYWDARTWPRRPELPPDSWVCVQAYRGVRESREDYEASVAREVARITGWGYHVVIIPQCYTSNDTLTKDLASVVPICLRIARDFPAVVAVLPFSGAGRATGLEDHPEVKPLWARVAAMTAAPVFVRYPPAPPVIPPVIPPVEEEIDSMMAYAPPVAGFLAGDLEPHPDGNGLVLVRKRNGKVLCCTPDGKLEERDAAGSWESFRRGKTCLIAERDERIYVLPLAE